MAYLPGVVGVIVLMVAMADFFVEGGIPIAGTVRSWTLQALPFATIVTTIFLIRSQISRLQKREMRRWYTSAFILVSFIVMFIAGMLSFDNPSANPVFAFMYDTFATVGISAVQCMVGLTYVSAYIRGFRARSVVTLWLVVITVLTIFTLTMLGEVTWYPLAQAGDWISRAISPGSENGIRTALYIGTIATVGRMIFLKERMRV